MFCRLEIAKCRAKANSCLRAGSSSLASMATLPTRSAPSRRLVPARILARCPSARASTVAGSATPIRCLHVRAIQARASTSRSVPAFGCAASNSARPGGGGGGGREERRRWRSWPRGRGPMRHTDHADGGDVLSLACIGLCWLSPACIEPALHGGAFTRLLAGWLWSPAGSGTGRGTPVRVGEVMQHKAKCTTLRPLENRIQTSRTRCEL